MTEAISNLKNKIGVFQLTMITVAFVASIRTVAMMAKYGLSSVFFYFIGALFFLIPTALVSAELSTTLPSKGGVYTWVGTAMPGPWGFLSIWIQFLLAMLGMPVFLSFLASTSTFCFASSLAENKVYVWAFILIVVWFSTFIAFFGMKTAGWINTIGTLCCLFIPLGLILTLAAIWVVSGNPINTPISFKALLPDLSRPENLIFLVGLVFSFTGMETSGSHALDMKNRNDYSKAMLLSSILIALMSFGALAIAVVIPSKEISLVAGLMEAFSAFLMHFHIGCLIPAVALMIVIGGVCVNNSATIGPAKGLFGASKGGEIPPVLSRQNKYGMPSNMFLFQAIIVTVITSLILFMPDVNSAYLLILNSATSIYMIMYILMFASGIILRYKKPDLERPYRIPGGNAGMWIVSVIGILSSLAAIVFSFIPPPGMDARHIFKYEFTSVACEVILIGLGLAIYTCRKPGWVNKEID